MRLTKFSEMTENDYQQIIADSKDRWLYYYVNNVSSCAWWPVRIGNLACDLCYMYELIWLDREITPTIVWRCINELFYTCDSELNGNGYKEKLDAFFDFPKWHKIQSIVWERYFNKLL